MTEAKKYTQEALDRQLVDLVDWIGLNHTTKLVLKSLKEGANPNATFSDGESVLHRALSRGDEEVVGALLRNGADPNKKSPYGNNLSKCFENRNAVELVGLLVEHGLKVNPDNDDFISPLHQVLSSSPNAIIGSTRTSDEMKEEMVAMLIEAGADIHAKGKDGRNILHAEFYKNDYPMISVIDSAIAMGVDVNDRDNFGNTPLHHARHDDEGGPDVGFQASLLIDAGADVFAKNNEGKLPSHPLAEMKRMEIEKQALMEEVKNAPSPFEKPRQSPGRDRGQRF